jgi:hypothetical protein
MAPKAGHIAPLKKYGGSYSRPILKGKSFYFGYNSVHTINSDYNYIISRCLCQYTAKYFTKTQENPFTKSPFCVNIVIAKPPFAKGGQPRKRQGDFLSAGSIPYEEATQRKSPLFPNSGP